MRVFHGAHTYNLVALAVMAALFVYGLLRPKRTEDEC